MLVSKCRYSWCACCDEAVDVDKIFQYGFIHSSRCNDNGDGEVIRDDDGRRCGSVITLASRVSGRSGGGVEVRLGWVVMWQTDPR
jgi:hypothetical protein